MIKLCPLYVRYLTSTGPLMTCHALKRKREKENSYSEVKRDEEVKKPIRRRLFLKKAQMVTGERRAKGRALLEALERPGVSQLQVREFVELADENGQVRPAPSKQSGKPFFIPESPL
ncbi:unnamed protein product [Porites lobata]|uniref:Uncharacterized protein n=1 Tax=Porites lobata TaxID=104759 RepID=A0ABN8NQ54_9CNID|nr:unnamed protein product [Porites lobata]